MKGAGLGLLQTGGVDLGARGLQVLEGHRDGLNAKDWQQIGLSSLTGTVAGGLGGGRLIADSGWHQPDADHCDNWWYELPWPASSDGYRRLASRIVAGLRDAYGITEPSKLVYKAWNERDGNREIELPLIGLR
ncbi:hypothetical protein OG203_06940 [Nocardia sp. NBC_01499]|uniref:TY-Chap domain-containing protein n=1 Tax=Nocardia sp. NBC_01499 TaxID=2903597 RepID=UPI003866DFF6